MALQISKFFRHPDSKQELVRSPLALMNETRGRFNTWGSRSVLNWTLSSALGVAALGCGHEENAGTGYGSFSAEGGGDEVVEGDGDGDGDGEAEAEGADNDQGDGDGDTGNREGDGDGDDLKYDVAPPDVPSDPEELACKVDFLFVIDNSGSMWDEQQALIENFPAFINSIEDLAIDDYHILVTKTDALWCQPENYLECDPGATPTACDNVLGAGVNHPNGPGASEENCNFTGGNRFMISSPDIVDEFTCAAQLGNGGSGEEMQMGAMVAALEQDKPGGCNVGVIRDDALLVPVLITDEEDEFSEGDPEEWYDTLVSTKNGNAEAIVALSLTNDNCNQSWPYRIYEALDLLGERHIKGSICNTYQYDEFFSAAIKPIDDACKQIAG